jgi:hypothetical protein
MFDELIKNTEKYFWRFNKDGDLILGTSDIEPKAKVTFTITKKWVNVAPIVEESPGNYVGKSHNYMKKSEEYEQVVQLVKLVKAFLKNDPKVDHDKAFKNTMKLLQDYYI